MNTFHRHKFIIWFTTSEVQNAKFCLKNLLIEWKCALPMGNTT